MDRKQIQDELKRIRQRIETGDESDLWMWVIPGNLACAQRPLRDDSRFGGGIGKRPPPLPASAKPFVQTWVDRVKAAGFRSIISLLEVAQLELHPEGLLGFYRSQGLNVESFPCTDYREPSLERKLQVLEAYHRLPHPVLLHCSAGIDRTTPIAAFILEKNHHT